MRQGETFQQYQSRLGTPMDAIDYALDKIVTSSEGMQFLDDWRAGDLTDWPEYRPKAAPTPDPIVPRRFYIAGAILLLFIAWLAFEIFAAGGAQVTGAFIAFFIATPAALLLHAGGVKASWS